MEVDREGSVLTLRGISKTFGRACALKDFDLDLRAGEAVAIVGQNGSGKSTLVKILCGYHQPDPGSTATLLGSDLRLGDPASGSSLRFVHQDLALVDTLSVAENFALTSGYPVGRGGRIRWRDLRRRAEGAMSQLGYEIDARQNVAQLRVGERVGLAIARALGGFEDQAQGRASAVLVLDEPTAFLPAPEVAQLFAAVDRVKAAGVAVLFISHRLEEVFDLADRVVVLRDGATVACRPTSEFTHDTLITAMLGREVTPRAERDRNQARRAAQPLLSVDGLAGRGLRRLDLTAAAGTIVGIAGVTGSGRDEVGPILGGESSREGGTVTVGAQELESGCPVAARRAGLGYVPSDRRSKALLPAFSLAENLTLLDLPPVTSAGTIVPKREREVARTWLDKLDVRPRDPAMPIQLLSGGNQQKVVLGRILRTEPRVVVLDEPTQGVDVGAKSTIHDLLRSVAESGAVVVVCSSDTEELVALADEVHVLRDGVVGATLRGESITDIDVDREVLGGAHMTSESMIDTRSENVCAG